MVGVGDTNFVDIRSFSKINYLTEREESFPELFYRLYTGFTMVYYIQNSLLNSYNW